MRINKYEIFFAFSFIIFMIFTFIALWTTTSHGAAIIFGISFILWSFLVWSVSYKTSRQDIINKG